MVKFLIEKGIDSISVNADKAKEISEYIKEIEDSLVAGTDKEPRKYQPETSPKLDQSEEPKKYQPEHESSIQKAEKESVEQVNPNLKQDIKAIEAEKKQYIKEHKEENNPIKFNPSGEPKEPEKRQVLDIF